jgi:hypothetical protein
MGSKPDGTLTASTQHAASAYILARFALLTKEALQQICVPRNRQCSVFSQFGSVDMNLATVAFKGADARRQKSRRHFEPHPLGHTQYGYLLILLDLGSVVVIWPYHPMRPVARILDHWKLDSPHGPIIHCASFRLRIDTQRSVRSSTLVARVDRSS